MFCNLGTSSAWCTWNDVPTAVSIVRVAVASRIAAQKMLIAARKRVAARLCWVNESRELTATHRVSLDL